jgi:hypothetical protein
MHRACGRFYCITYGKVGPYLVTMPHSCRAPGIGGNAEVCLPTKELDANCGKTIEFPGDRLLQRGAWRIYRVRAACLYRFGTKAGLDSAAKRQPVGV